MPPKGSGKAKEGNGRAKAKAAPAKAKAAPPRAGPNVVPGARVRVECADGSFYEGNVDSWDAAAGEWRIVLDDGASPCLPVHACPRLLAPASPVVRAPSCRAPRRATATAARRVSHARYHSHSARWRRCARATGAQVTRSARRSMQTRGT